MLGWETTPPSQDVVHDVGEVLVVFGNLLSRHQALVQYSPSVQPLGSIPEMHKTLMIGVNHLEILRVHNNKVFRGDDRNRRKLISLNTIFYYLRRKFYYHFLLFLIASREIINERWKIDSKKRSSVAFASNCFLPNLRLTNATKRLTFCNIYSNYFLCNWIF